MDTVQSNAGSEAEGARVKPPLRVLCVDDHRDIADSTVMLLRTVGFEAQACYDGPSALQLAEHFRPSVCLLDLQMPGMAGDELAQRLLAQPGWRPLVLVAVTAMGEEAYGQRLRAAGFHLHLVKPVHPEQLVAMVDQLFRDAEAQARWETGTAHEDLPSRAEGS